VKREPEADDWSTIAARVVYDSRRTLVLEVTQSVLWLDCDLQPQRDRSVVVPPVQVSGERKLEASAADVATVQAQAI
jgi:hypothetical protein